MSGIEVVGLVLGILPIAISVVQTYKGILASKPRVEKELNQLARDLELEQNRLRGSCEKLLSGIVAPSMIHSLINDPNPFGPKWKAHLDEDLLRLRLWTGADHIQWLMDDMKDAACELRVKLKIQDGKAALADKDSIFQELKGKTSFTLKKKDYDEILERIRKGNTALLEIATRNCDLEPDRKRYSQDLLIKLLRGLADSIFCAITKALTCSCMHRLNLELIQRKALFLPDDDTSKKARDFKFNILIGANEDDDMSLDEKTSDNTLWHGLQIQLGDFRQPPPTPPSSDYGQDSMSLISSVQTSQSSTVLIKQPSSLEEARISRRLRWTKTVKFILPQRSVSATQTLVETVQACMPVISGPQTPLYAMSELQDICNTIRKGKNVRDYYGYICDMQDRTFGVYPQQKLGAGCSRTVTLRQVLEGGGKELPAFYYEEKLKVALALAANVLHLYTTPWLSKVVTLDDVVFLLDDNIGLNAKRDIPYSAFISVNISDESKSLVRTPVHCAIPPGICHTKKPMSLTVLSLGALLIQVILGTPIDALEIPADLDKEKVLQTCHFGYQYQDKILIEGSNNYWEAVKWCLGSVAGISGLEDEKVCQEFYEGVVVPLEEALGELKRFAAVGKQLY